ncbi:peptide chain release factor N(5)-glutamine methyltransferase [Aquabacterium sp. A08]|uniref:peptide chain release factor N(5)-glutamine methyltransferase n=1 Tax=Aquabacterium sp. A08 TaxID=2718532 RepID=UPI0014232260|nr:peptide chain release factor N(5)-glutamine methyltransferase [Aquabacterium sp. A08]NIC40263.1 peptide chain release factor N(5)-glutamine methyltransferase [Aquabacterium sp. A08]
MTQTTPPTVQQALHAARQAGLDRLDAQLLLLHRLGRSPHDRAWLIAHDTDALPADVATAFHALCQRRLAGEPVAYLIGQREFHGLTLQVDARVLDPRPDTETLVDWGLDVLDGHGHPSVLDLGTGSGAIALALQHRRPDAQVWALDASADALAVAQANARRLQLPVRTLRGAWLRDWPLRQAETRAQHPQGPALPDRFDLIVSNPPYLRTDDPHLAALTHEPLSALASGPDGLADLREIAAQAPAHLRPGGWLLLEHGWDQADAVADLLRAQGYTAVAHRHDLAGHRRCTGGRWLPPVAPQAAP